MSSKTKPMNTPTPTQPAPDRWEHSRSGFEKAHPYLSYAWNEKKNRYRDSTTLGLYEVWCEALDWQAAQQPDPPRYLDRPDAPGWWWRWDKDINQWDCWDIGSRADVHNGIWSRATLPPAPTQKEGEG